MSMVSKNEPSYIEQILATRFTEADAKAAARHLIQTRQLEFDEHLRLVVARGPRGSVPTGHESVANGFDE